MRYTDDGRSRCSEDFLVQVTGVRSETLLGAVRSLFDRYRGTRREAHGENNERKARDFAADLPLANRSHAIRLLEPGQMLRGILFVFPVEDARRQGNSVVRFFFPVLPPVQ